VFQVYCLPDLSTWGVSVRHVCWCWRLVQVYYPYLLMNKKRYAGLLWTKPDKYDKMDSKVGWLWRWLLVLCSSLVADCRLWLLLTWRGGAGTVLCSLYAVYRISRCVAGPVVLLVGAIAPGYCIALVINDLKTWQQGSVQHWHEMPSSL